MQLSALRGLFARLVESQEVVLLETGDHGGVIDQLEAGGADFGDDHASAGANVIHDPRAARAGDTIKVDDDKLAAQRLRFPTRPAHPQTPQHRALPL